MTSKYILIILVLLFALIVLFPLVLSLAGVPVFQFASPGGGQADGGVVLLRSSNEGNMW